MRRGILAANARYESLGLSRETIAELIAASVRTESDRLVKRRVLGANGPYPRAWRAGGPAGAPSAGRRRRTGGAGDQAGGGSISGD